MISNQEIGMRIRNLLAERQISVRELQNRMGLESAQAVYKWLHGKSLPNLENMVGLCQILGVQMEDILLGKPNAEGTRLHPSFQKGGERRKILLQPSKWQLKKSGQNKTLFYESAQNSCRRREGQKPLPGYLRQMLLAGWDLEYGQIQNRQARQARQKDGVQ